MPDNLKCCFCGEDAGQYGHNTEPVSSGRCCEACNAEVVIPARLLKFAQAPKKES